MNLLDNKLYNEDLKNIKNLDINYNLLKDKTILISGATGMIGSFIVDLIMKLNLEDNLNCKIYAMGRTIKKAQERFSKYYDNDLFEFISGDINIPIERKDIQTIDYIIHLASYTHPKAYSTYPIETITTNVIGTKNLLDFALKHNNKRFVFASSVEVYGENKGDTEKFNEDYLGYINCNTLRAGYPEAKRVGEALCQAYIKQEKMDIVIPRIARVWGPTMLMNDSKALSQFIKNGINKENIVLKSKGNQYFSYIYVADVVSRNFKSYAKWKMW